jgi:hypothetical protein
MSKPITVPDGAPPYICADLLNAIDLEVASDVRLLEELERQVAEGEATDADALRTIDEFPESSRETLLAYCRDNCSAGHCAMKGFGVELVDTDRDTLSPDDKVKLDFFMTVDATRAAGKMSLGIPLF